MALVFGTGGLPAILMGFFTVPPAMQARKSVIWAMAIIGGFYVLTLFLGFGAAKFVGSTNIAAVDAGGTLGGALLGQNSGGWPTVPICRFLQEFSLGRGFWSRQARGASR